jgi:hypothetical protein
MSALADAPPRRLWADGRNIATEGIPGGRMNLRQMTKKLVLKPPTAKPVPPDPDAPPPVDPFAMYDVAMASDKVLKIKRALEANGFKVKVETNISVDISLTITEPKKQKA